MIWVIHQRTIADCYDAHLGTKTRGKSASRGRGGGSGRRAGYRPVLAWTCCDYADALRERNGEGDRAKAISLLDESLAISSELGMRPLMERVLSRREILGA